MKRKKWKNKKITKKTLHWKIKIFANAFCSHCIHTRVQVLYFIEYFPYQ